MGYVNYKQIYAIKKQNEEKIKSVCPQMINKSGIYIFHKVDENGFKKYYCGQALRLIERCSQHLSEYDHIALSLKKYGFYSESNPYAWKLDYFYCNERELDNKEQETIALWHKEKGYIPYNKTGGGQNSKFGINENKPSKGYRDGLQQGYKNAQKEIRPLFDKYLDYNIKAEKQGNRFAGNAVEKFKNFLVSDNANI